jgi:hypothetical protein
MPCCPPLTDCVFTDKIADLGDASGVTVTFTEAGTYYYACEGKPPALILGSYLAEPPSS